MRGLYAQDCSFCTSQTSRELRMCRGAGTAADAERARAALCETAKITASIELSHCFQPLARRTGVPGVTRAATGSLNAMLAELSVSLWRGGEDGRYETYSVPRRESQTVLDVVTFVQRHIDPTLSYRFACRVGVCGSCAMTVNGRPRWTCRTHVSKVAGDGHLEIGPLENLPVIKDLTTDMEGFFEKWKQAQRASAPTKPRQ